MSCHAMQFATEYAQYLDDLKRWPEARNFLFDVIDHLDMDHGALTTRPRMNVTWGMVASGLSKKETIREIMRLFSQRKQTSDLIDHLHRRIDSGDDMSRRVLAQVMRELNRPNDALALELEFVDKGQFGLSNALARRADIYRVAGNAKEAAREYELALALVLPLSKMSREDYFDEEIDRSTRNNGGIHFSYQSYCLTNGRLGIVLSLIETYRNLNETNRRLDWTLHSIDYERMEVDDLKRYEDLGAEFESAMRGLDFKAWLRDNLNPTKHPARRAISRILLGDLDGAVDDAVEALKKSIDEPPRFHFKGMFGPGELGCGIRDWGQAIRDRDPKAGARFDALIDKTGLKALSIAKDKEDGCGLPVPSILAMPPRSSTTTDH